jgi:hypothetical protein
MPGALKAPGITFFQTSKGLQNMTLGINNPFGLPPILAVMISVVVHVVISVIRALKREPKHAPHQVQ